jgi:hypothetical protein
MGEYHLDLTEVQEHMGQWWHKDHLGDPGMDGRIILKWILKK